MNGRYIVQFSTGAGSAEVLLRCIELVGVDNVVALTADTRVEDSDNWRFAHEVIDKLATGAEWHILSRRMTPMEAGRKARAVPNNRMAICSRVLKRELLREWIDEHCRLGDVMALGFDWTEQDRHDDSARHLVPFGCVSPLMWPPLIDKVDILAKFRAVGIEPPRLYAEGFDHANCGGACVRAGQAQWAHTLKVRPATYAAWEAEENFTRDMLGKDVSILKDRRGGSTKPMSLTSFRLRLDADGNAFDANDRRACGCDPFGSEQQEFDFEAAS